MVPLATEERLRAAHTLQTLYARACARGGDAEDRLDCRQMLLALRGATAGRAGHTTQAAFARQIEVSLGTLRGWEQGRFVPSGPARVLIRLLYAHMMEATEISADIGERSDHETNGATKAGKRRRDS